MVISRRRLLALALLCLAPLAPTRPSLAQDAAGLAQATASQRALARAPRLPRASFLEPRTLPSVQLSPDGRHVAYLREHGDTRSLWLLPASGGPARVLVARTAADRVSWSGDGRWLFLRAPAALSTVAIDGRPGTRIPLGGRERRAAMQVDASQPAAVLLRERVAAGAGERWRIVRMDAHGRRTRLWEDARWVHEIAVDARGNPVALVRFEGDHDALLRVRPGGRVREVLRLRPMERAIPLAVLPDGGVLLEGNVGGDLVRLLRLDPDDRLRTLHVDPHGEADLDGTVLDPVTRLPLAASYRSTDAATHGIGAGRAIVADIVRRFPGYDLELQAAGTAWLVCVRAATLRDPRWYLYDPARRRARRILDAPALTAKSPPERALARKLAIRYLASDGMPVHGFVLLPPGVDASRAPLVAQVHGGPISHFRAGYDGVAQFLANRGYVVFQSNFRGSTGHGRAYAFAPGGDYGNGRVQQDIVEGVRWLLARGVGDPRRVGIVGHSFGGYSTLLGLTFQPDLFKVGVAGAAPADLAWSMRWLLEAGDQGALPDRSLRHTLRALSLDPGDDVRAARLHAQSPVANASKLRRPLLLVAGGADRTVAIREVVHYAARLHQLGKPATLLVEPGGAHSPADPVPREAYLFGMETMLQRHLGGPPPQPPGARLDAYLRANLRMAGPEFAAYARPR